MTRNKSISILQMYARHKISSVYNHLGITQGEAIFFLQPDFVLDEWKDKVIRDLWR